MGKTIDETGNVYGRLTVLRQSENDRKGAFWLCRCDCGREHVVSGANLRNGSTQSCGCKQHKHFKDETGHRYGKLVVIRRAENSKHGQPMWLCQCDCGEQTVARGSHLRRGSIKSCGCNQGRPNDLSGQRFGRLTVIEPLKKRGTHNRIIWRCRCDCGNESNVSAGALRKKGGTRSCGCLKILPPGEAAFNSLWKAYTYSAKKRGLEFGLTKAQFRELTKQRCHYCGQEPSREHGDPGLNGTYTCNGLDRKDNTRGYTFGNIVPCCQVCNFTKASRDYNEFTEWIDQVVRFHLGRTNKERTNDRHEV